MFTSPSKRFTTLRWRSDIQFTTLAPIRFLLPLYWCCVKTYLQFLKDISAVVSWDVIGNRHNNIVITTVFKGDWLRMQKQRKHQQRSKNVGNYHPVAHLVICEIFSVNQTKLARLFQTSVLHWHDTHAQEITSGSPWLPFLCLREQRHRLPWRW